MPTKKIVMGTSRHVQPGRRTSGHSARQANAARQKASRGPDQPARYGDLTKKPLVLHMMAAISTRSLACRSEGIVARRPSSDEGSAAEPGSSNPKSSSMMLPATEAGMLTPGRRKHGT